MLEFELDESNWKLSLYIINETTKSRTLERPATGEERRAFEDGIKYGIQKAKRLLRKHLDAILEF